MPAYKQGRLVFWRFTLCCTGCGQTFTNPEGVIVSPGYPNNYGNNLNCTYDIIVNPQHFIILQFDRNHFQIEQFKQEINGRDAYPEDFSKYHYMDE